MADAIDTLDELKQLAKDPTEWVYNKLTDKQGRVTRELRAQVRAGVVSLLVDVAAIYIVGSALSGGRTKPARAGRRKF
jgi:hypothetical protein